IADELRHDLINAVSKTGGHLGAGLGVVELAGAVHHVFDTPPDRLVWDVGHPSYPHKILTGRPARLRTIRQGRGPSGVTKSAPRANMTRSALPIRRPRSPPASAWRWRAR